MQADATHSLTRKTVITQVSQTQQEQAEPEQDIVLTTRQTTVIILHQMCVQKTMMALTGQVQHALTREALQEAPVIIMQQATEAMTVLLQAVRLPHVRLQKEKYATQQMDVRFQ